MNSSIKLGIPYSAPCGSQWNTCTLSKSRWGRGSMRFWGQSFACNAFGKVLYQASDSKEEIVIQTIDYKQSDYYRIHWPFLRDRRIDSYGSITKRFLDDES